MQIIIPSDAALRAALGVQTENHLSGCVGSDCAEGGDCTGGTCSSCSDSLALQQRPTQESTIVIDLK